MMKRHPDLISLSQEHHQSLRLAKRCLDTVAQGDAAAIQALCQSIAADFDAEWEQHFQHEEQTIFQYCTDGQLQKLAQQLKQEHDQMRAMAKQFAAGDCRALESFGQLLKTHTRLEERQFFPLVEKYFNAEQLQQIAAWDKQSYISCQVNYR